MMSDNSQKLDCLLNDIEMECDPGIGSEECNRFSLECLSLVKTKLPPVATESVAVLNGYREGRVLIGSITQAIQKCWQYLEKNQQHAPISNPVVSAVRAVICVLDAQRRPEERDIVDHLSFFLRLVNNVEPHYDEEELFLRKHFAGCLKNK